MTTMTMCADGVFSAALRSYAADLGKSVNQTIKQGTPIPTNDIWIAAEALEMGGTLYSYDGHFAEIPILNWVDCRGED